VAVLLRGAAGVPGWALALGVDGVIRPGVRNGVLDRLVPV
jgi:hypothetical protein